MSSLGGALPAARPAGLARFLATRRSLVRGGSLLVGATLLWHASNFAFNAVAARLLGPRGYSELAAAVVLLYVASPVLVSVQTIASRATTALNVQGRTAEIRPALVAYLRRIAFVALLVSAGLTLASSGVARFLRLHSGVPIAIIGVGLCLSLLAHCQRGVLQGAQRFDRVAASTAVEATAKVVGAVALLAVWRSVDGAVAAIPLAAACGLAVNALLLRFLPTSHRNSEPIALPGAGYQSAAAFVTFVVLAVLLSADILAAKRYLPPSTAGIYAAVSLCGKVVYFATSAISLLLFPQFSERYEQKRDGRKILGASLGVVAALSGILVGIYFLAPAVVVIPLYGAGYRAAEPYLGRIAIAFAFYALTYLAATYLLARRSWLGAAALSIAAFVQLAALYSFHGSINEVVRVQIVVLGSTSIALVTLALSAVRCRSGDEPPHDSGGIAVSVVGDLESRRRSVAKGGRVTTTAPPLPASPPKAAHDATPQERAIVAAVRQSIGEVPVILCGSRGNGTHLPLSDYDVLVVVPWRQMPLAITKLGALSVRLTGTCGAPVTINPLPERNLRRHTNLFLWKVAHEGRVLSSPPGFTLPRVTRPPYDDSVRFSYLMSALQELLKGVDEEPLRRDDATHKALLMLVQLRLLERGLYSSTLDNALSKLEPEDRESLELDETADLWRQTCSKVLVELASVPARGWLRAVRVNVRYAVLALLRGRVRVRTALSVRRIDRRLADTAMLLASILIDRRASDATAMNAVCDSLPRSLRHRTSPTWRSLRAVLMQEWPDAHPLIAQ